MCSEFFPQFEISPEDARGQSFTGTTASECHKKLLDAVLKNRLAGGGGSVFLLMFSSNVLGKLVYFVFVIVSVGYMQLTKEVV